MATGFRRTRSGQAARHHFHEAPILWVEGDDDVTAYQWIEAYGVRIQVAGGKERCKTLGESILGGALPDAVVMDGDYELATRRRSPHRRIVILDRYAIENYFVDPSIICATIFRLASRPADPACAERWDVALDTALQTCGPLIKMDIACTRAQDGLRILPRPAARLFVGNLNPAINLAEVHRLATAARDRAPSSREKEGEKYLQQWAERSSPAFAVCSDFVFALARRFVLSECALVGQSRNVDNRALFALLAATMWELSPHQDHVRLRGRLRRAASALLEHASSAKN